MTERTAVMVIEDDDGVRQLMVDILSDEGHLVIECTTGQDALSRLGTLRPSAITLDLAMPGMDGLAFLRTLRAMPAVSDTPVVVVSGAPEAVRAQLSEGGTVTIGKPFHMDEFVAAVHQAASSRRWVS